MMKKGFSLIELIVVVGIISILATIGVSNYLSTRNQKRLEFATEVLVRELNFTMTRSRAQENGYQWWIHFDNLVSGNDFYSVCYGVYTGSGADCVADGGNEFKRTVLGSGLEFVDEPASGTSKDVVFAKATGLHVDAAGLPATTIVKISSTSGAGFKTVTVNPNGNITF